MSKKRIWELDAFRGICILGMVIVHFIYDLVELYGILDWQYPAVFSFVKNWGGVLFILISGISATLGRRSVRRGLIVIGCGFICTAVTYGMYYFNMSDKGIIIYFGVLHCLGCCMILWHFFKKLSNLWLTIVGVVLIGVGLWLRGQIFNFPWLMPLGFLYRGFVSSDYFPLLLNLGFFLIGTVLGRTLYRKKTTLFPKVRTNKPAVRFLSACGKHSLWIYLLHQPVLSLISMLIAMIVL